MYSQVSEPQQFPFTALSKIGVSAFPGPARFNTAVVFWLQDPFLAFQYSPPAGVPIMGRSIWFVSLLQKKKKKKIEITNVLAGLFRHGSGNRAICPITPSSLANRLFHSDVPSEREHQLYSVVSRPDTDPPHHGKNVRGMSHCNLYWASEMRRTGSSENL